MSTVVIFGAGATKACGGPMTNEILPDVYGSCGEIKHKQHLALLEKFLVENFHVPRARTRRQPGDYPGLPLLLSLLDTALDRKHPLRASSWWRCATRWSTPSSPCWSCG